MRTAARYLPLLIVLLAIPAAYPQELGLHSILEKPILAPNQPTVEVKAYTAARVPALRIPTTRLGDVHPRDPPPRFR